MKTKAFYTVISTDNMDESLKFYTELLGFRIAHRVETPKGLCVVVENDDGARIDIMEIKSEPGFYALRTNVDDIDAAVEEFRSKGYEVTGPMDISTGRAILVKDPNGIVIDVVQHIKK